MAKKKVVDQSKLCEDVRIQVEQDRKFGKRRGINNKPIDVALPTYDKAQCEKIIADGNNNFIIMGRDRPNTKDSGYGSQGATAAARIDLIAGMASNFPGTAGAKSYGPPCSGTVVNPNFAMDGARVYISQQADIDAYMGITTAHGSNKTPNSIGESAIGLKADAIRIHARKDVKIVTGRMLATSTGKAGELLAHGGKNESVGSISFIAGNYGGYRNSRGRLSTPLLQPLVKGDTLAQCLQEMLGLMAEIYTVAATNVDYLRSLNQSTGGHIHTLAAPIPLPTIPSPTQLPFASVLEALTVVEKSSGQVLGRRIGNVSKNYLHLDSNAPEPAKNIKSKYVFTT